MRQVVLNGTTAPLEDAALREQMTRHLLARLNEYEPEGMTARPDGPGTVLAQIGQMSGEQAVRALADQGVQALAAGERASATKRRFSSSVSAP